MHIPDGYLSPQTYIPLLGAAAVFWSTALRKVRDRLSHRHVPYLAMAAAFSFLIQMFNIPIPGGTSGHAVGGAVIAILLGPWAAVLAISIVLVIQAVVFGDGGITAIGANCFNMATVLPFIGYGTFKAVCGTAREGTRVAVAAFLAGYIGLFAASLTAAVQFGIQPIIAADAQGTPLYAPYPLSVAVPAMVFQHLILFGVVEGMVTVLLLRYFIRNEKDLIYAFGGGQA
ncbi:MAG TPA: cobalt transporter CbiM [Dissulfurispiraceae bacterium]|nr:cobalt transporter CbiM [Dissulfurispiraceae bacterium]